MSEILPDIPDAPSGWSTDNHYFYEIVNRSGKSVFIQLALSSRNATEDFMDMCDRINEYYPSKVQKAEWQWRTPFKTSTVEIAEELSKEAIFAGLDGPEGDEGFLVLIRVDNRRLQAADVSCVRIDGHPNLAGIAIFEHHRHIGRPCEYGVAAETQHLNILFGESFTRAYIFT